MDTGSGHIYDLNKGEVRDIRGKMVEWKVGEKVEVKDCLFEVVEIKCCPEDKIILKGLAKEMNLFKELAKELPSEKTYKAGLSDFLGKK